ncbi:TPA: hypothetical protein IUZ89_001874 [Enterococcus faecalis]|nr:hypothetical protein [Enterococcus faecalis]
MSASPVDATDAQAVISATAAVSSDEAIATITKNEDGSFSGAIIAEGTATFEFTSGEFRTSIAVTGTPAS